LDFLFKPEVLDRLREQAIDKGLWFCIIKIETPQPAVRSAEVLFL